MKDDILVCTVEEVEETLEAISRVGGDWMSKLACRLN